MAKPERIPYLNEWPLIIEWGNDDLHAARKFFLDELKSLLKKKTKEVSSPGGIHQTMLLHMWLACM